MNWVDVGVLSVVGLSILIGIFRGFIREALSLVSCGVAIVCGIYFHDAGAEYLSTWISSAPIRSVAAFGLVFVCVLIICSIISHLIGFLVKKSGLSGTDRMLGLIFGFVRGVLICGVMLLVVSFSPLKQNPVWRESFMVPQFQPLMAWLNENVPDKVNFAKDVLEKRNQDRASQAEHLHKHMPNVAALKSVTAQFPEDD